MGRSCILDSNPGRWMPAAVRMPAVVWMPACHRRELNRHRHRLTEPTTKASCQPPPPPPSNTSLPIPLQPSAGTVQKTITPGNTCGDTDMMYSQAHADNFVAKGPVRTFCITREIYQKIMHSTFIRKRALYCEFLSKVCCTTAINGGSPDAACAGIWPSGPTKQLWINWWLGWKSYNFPLLF